LLGRFPEDQTDSAKHLAHACAQNDPDAIDKINKILADTQLDIDDIENSVRERKAEEFAQKYARRESKCCHTFGQGSRQREHED
jgi:hypothetical protein